MENFDFKKYLAEGTLLKEVQLDPENQKLKDHYIDAYLSMTMDPYYYDENAKKKIINATAGTIDYTNGVIVLNDFRVLSSKEPDGLIRLTVKSQKGILTSSKNTIITIDEADPTSISTELVAI